MIPVSVDSGARDDPADAILDALADRGDEGLTVFELRTHVDADIDAIEEALAELKRDDRIVVDETGNRTRIKHADHSTESGPTASILDRLRALL